jgi:hypothetical protein
VPEEAVAQAWYRALGGDENAFDVFLGRLQA